MKMNNTLPCPFCGGEAEGAPGTCVDLMTQDNRPCVGCCVCQFVIRGDTLIKARSNWNTRTAAAQPGKPCAHWKHEGEYGRIGKSNNCYHPDCDKWKRTATALAPKE